MIQGLWGLGRGSAWTKAEIEAFQLRQLQRLVAHAFERVPYYRRLFQQAGLHPRHIRTLHDLQLIPASSRADLQSLPVEQIVARGIRPEQLVRHRTSGSSGMPFSIHRTLFEDRLLQLHRLRILSTMGFRITDRRAAVVTRRLQTQPLYMKLGLLPYEEIECQWPPERILSELRRIQPQVLRGYPASLSWLADHVTSEDQRLIRPHLITTDSELLTPEMRRRVEAAFRAPVRDFYDSHEFNLIGSECPRGGSYHVSDLSVLAEVIKDGRPAESGEEGELIGTALHSWAMPFIRYRQGDQVTRGKDACICGAPNSLLSAIQGRLMDRFLLSDGSTLHPYALVYPLLNHAPWVQRFQIVQERRDLISVTLVPAAGTQPTPLEVSALEQVLRARIQERASLAISLTSHIPSQPNGKFRPYYSMCTQSECALSEPKNTTRRHGRD